MGPVHRAHAVHLTQIRRVSRARLTHILLGIGCALPLACAGTAPPPPATPEIRRGLPAPLPDATGFGTHVLALKRAEDGALWAGTYGQGIYVMRARSDEWEHIGATSDTASLSWGFVNSIAFGRDPRVIWYGTVGNGFGRSADSGGTWRNWEYDQLGPVWQYVVPDGIVVRRDTVYIATSDGLRISGDQGQSWRCVQAEGPAGGAAQREDGCTERIRSLPTAYLLSIDVAADGTIWLGHLRGLSFSRDGGRTWSAIEVDGIAGRRIRAVRHASDSTRWVANEQAVFVDSARNGSFRQAQIRVPGYTGLPGAPRALIPSPGLLPPAVATSHGMVARSDLGDYRIFYLGAADRYRPAGDIWTAAWWGPPLWPIGGSSAGLARVLAGDIPSGIGLFLDTVARAEPGVPRHLWFQRPIAEADGNPYIDASYLYGSTMGGNFQQHQAVEFNNPAGTPVRAIGDGVVVYAGPAEQGALTVAIRHDRQWEGQYVFSTYYHNSSLSATVGQRVSAGTVIAQVGNTGRATNHHLHLEVHVAPGTDSSAIVHPDVRFPPHTVNPQLFLQPMPGTGIVAGRVFDGRGQPVAGARVYGLVLAYPAETPFSFVETYGDRARGTPAYGEHFAVGDVPAGTYTLGVMIEGRRVWRRIRVAENMVTWVEFRP